MGKKKGKSPRKSGGPTPRAQFVAEEEDFPTLGSPQPPVQPTIEPTQQPANVPTIVPMSVPTSVPTSAPTTPTEPQSSQQSSATESAVSQKAVSSRRSPTSQKIESDLAEDVKKMIKFEPRISMKFPNRPKDSVIGRPLHLLANHFLLRVGKKKAFHYDIEIERAIKSQIKDPNVVDKEIEDTNVSEKKKNKFSRKLATKLNRKIFQSMVDYYSRNGNRVFANINPVYDGQKNMFTSKILEGTQGKQSLRLAVTLSDEGRDSEFFVNIKMAESNEEIDLNILNLYHRGITCDDEALKKSVLFINTLLRHNSTMNWVPIGQSIFKDDVVGQQLGRYLLLAYGFYSSVRNLMVGPTLNIDRSAAAFYNETIPLYKLIGYIINGDLTRIPPKTHEFETIRRKVRKELSGLQVEARHISYGTSYRKFRILGLSSESAKDIKFDWEEKNNQGVFEMRRRQISVVDYFQQKYNRRLSYPQLPCLEVGNPNNVVKLPLEVCKLVPHQRLRRSMTNNERSEMTRISGQQLPHERLKSCEDTVKDLFYSNEDMANKNKRFLTEFEINVDQKLLKVESTVILPPNLKYRNTKGPVVPVDGEWEMFKTSSHFLRPQSLNNWIVINMSFEESFGDNVIHDFCKELCSQAEEMGMNTEKPKKVVLIRRFTPKLTFNGIKNNLNAFKNLKMVLFITPDKSNIYSDDIYSEIKLLGDVQHSGGLTTQCVNVLSVWNPRSRDPRRMKKWNRSYLRQLMLKVNPKLGGTNVALLDSTSMPSLFKEKLIMIVGADVNHPAPADKISPSIAALVGSYDNEFSNYYTTVRMQPKSREEMIKFLDEMMIELLINYQRKQKNLPQKIIFYRDGVSEGQFQHVIDNEYPLLTKAFTKMNIKPKLTFIVVQKRHHTRFMTADKMINIPPGTVVEKSVTHKNDFDFYLCSHAGRIGTSRSAHYYVLADENHFTSNDMCKMTYYLCHIYQRCTKSVSIPAPVYYADLAAYRAKVHASSHSNDVRSIISGDESDDIQINDYKEAIRVSDAQKERLYFC